MENPADQTPVVEPQIASVPTDAALKPRWRRIAEVSLAVAAFAVAMPVVVNGLASAINKVGDSESITAATTAATTPTDTAPPANIAQQIVGSVITEPPSNEPATATPTTVAAAAAGNHSHGAATPEQPLTHTERTELAEQLVTARTTALTYPTVADALAAGYTMVTTYLPLIGAHYIKGAIMDGTFDITQPEMLLYDGTSPKSNIVGLSYYMFSDTEPTPFVGPNDHWHQHIGLCIKDGVVVGGEQLSAEKCAARGGAKAGLNNGWMIHAWVVPGWDSPEGVFSPEHQGLVANLDPH